MSSLVAKGALVLIVVAGAAFAAGVTDRGGSTDARDACATPDVFDADRLPSTPSRQWATDGYINAVLPCGTTVFVGGDFNVIGPFTGGFASVSARTGAPDPAMPTFARDVTAITSDRAKGWIVGRGGEHFEECAELTRVLRDGSILWRKPICPGPINAIATKGSAVYVGGRFLRAGGAPRLNAAALDRRTGRPLHWDPRVGGTEVYDRDEIIPREVNAISVVAQRVYLGGFFDRVGGKKRVNVTVVDAKDGRLLDPHPLDFGDYPFDSVKTIAVANGRIYIGGFFDSVNGHSRLDAAAVDATTGSILPWDPRVGGGVNSILVTPSSVIIGGRFSSVRGLGRTGVAAVSANTGAPLAWAPTLRSPRGERCVEQVIDVRGRVAVVGNFLTVNGEPHPYAALLDPKGRVARWPVTPAGAVHAVARNGDRVALGGSFGGVGGAPRSHLAAIDVRTGRVGAWAPQLDSWVTSLAADNDLLFVGGGFTHVGTEPRRDLAAFNLRTRRLTPWRVNVTGQSVDALSVDRSTLYVGGDFSGIAGERREALAAVAISDAHVLAFAASLEPELGLIRPMVSGILTARDRVFVTGLISGQTSNSDGFVALDSRTGDEAWSVRLTPVGFSDSGEIAAVAVTNSRLFLLGDFAGVNGAPRRGAAAVDFESGELLPWKLHVRGGELPDAPFATGAAAAAAGDWVAVGGDFSSINGRRRAGVAAVASTGTAVASWRPVRELGGYEATLVPYGKAVYVYSFNDAALAAFTAPTATAEPDDRP